MSDARENEFSHVTDPHVLHMARMAKSDAANELSTPYFSDAERGITLHQGDALRLLERLPSETFEVIFADPPYFLSSGGITCQSGKRVSVDKGVWDKTTTFEEMHAFNRAWLKECQRLLKPNGTLWVSGTMHNIFSVGYAMQTLGYKILNDIAWYKVNPPPNLACRYFTHATETVLWARKSPQARHLFHYDAMKVENGGTQMQSLWKITPPSKWEKRFGKHPTQKPEALLSRIIRSSSNPGDLVLDPFCGSGTTGVVCARLGRQFVGIEQEASYLDLAVRRLIEELPAIPLPAPRISPPKQVVPWADLVTAALRNLGGEAHLQEINDVIGHDPNLRQTRTWPSTVRRVVRQCPRFAPLGKGRYRLRDQMTLNF